MTAADSYQQIPTTFKFTTAGSSSGDIAVPAADSLTLVVYSTGLSGAGTCNLVFNADTGTNYVTRYLTFSGTTPSNVGNASAASAIFTPSQTTAFIATFKICNVATLSKAFTYIVSFVGASPAAGPNPIIGGGEWVNITSRITTIRMATSANNYGVESGFICYGGFGL